MDNHLTHGWNKSFFQWIRKVRVAKSKKIYLVEQLKLYRSKLTSCKGTNFEKSPTSYSYCHYDTNFFWLSKIEELELEIKKNDELINSFNEFLLMLGEQEKKILYDVIIKRFKVSVIAKEMGISRNRIYEIKNSIVRIWNTM
jgi:DNA-directed RNA polymerase specialized sigma subunit